MLFIKVGDGKIHAFHVGESKEFLRNFCENVVSIQADGDELTHIVRTFSNIPQVNHAVVSYYGDMAKFILDNW